MTRIEFEAALAADGYTEIEAKPLPPRPACIRTTRGVTKCREIVGVAVEIDPLPKWRQRRDAQ
ncbi:MAG: hypothetical protein ABL904_19775 [Hyphomicrobiaceae bacterium]